MQITNDNAIEKIARLGLIAKGIVYCLLGILAFMAAFEIGGQSNKDTNVKGMFRFVYDQTGGQIIVALLVIGLLCYTAWRMIQAFSKNYSSGKMDWKKRLRYFWSGLIYLFLSFFAIKLLLHKDNEGGGNSQQSIISEIFQKPMGQWIIGIIAVAIGIAGIYQIYYGLSEKYKKHISELSQHTSNTVLLNAGKVGYVARGIVWLIISWLLLKATLKSDSGEAADTSGAFTFLENSTYGSYLFGAVSLGLVCYGIYNFIRARYEHF